MFVMMIMIVGRMTDMTTEQAMTIADRFSGDEVQRLEIAIELLKANEEGYKEAMKDTSDCLGRIQSGDPRKEVK